MITVAQFRRTMFQPTETFLYNYITAFRRIIPLCVTLQRKNADLFPLSNPVVELYSWSNWHQTLRRLNAHFWPSRADLKYDRSQTFEALCQYGVSVLHAHFGYVGAQVLPVKRKTGLPLITTFYGYDISELAALPKWQSAYSQLFDEGDLFLVEGPHMREHLIEIGCPPEKAGIQRIAVHTDKYPFRSRLPPKSGQPIRILFCGSLREKKGLVYALEAVQRVQKVFPDLEFRIVGDGGLRSLVERTIDLFCMHTYTVLLGFLTHERMIQEMNSADIFIHPSVTAANGDSEGGAPTVILEAQACGLPILSTTHADIPNVVVPNVSALLAPERDVDTLSNHLLELLRDPERWADMGESGRAHIMKYHDITNEVKRLEDWYYTLYQRTA